MFFDMGIYTARTDKLSKAFDAIRERLRNEWKRGPWEMRDHLGKPVGSDRISAVIDQARENLQSRCTPYLREPNFIEFAIGGNRND